MATALERAIDAQTTDWRERLALRLGALLEGGSLSGPWPSGDAGASHGPYQINSNVHAVSYAEANDPAFAVSYMLGEYRAGVARVERERPGLWASSPVVAASLAAFYAERPREMYPESRVQSAGAQLAAWLMTIGKTAGTVIPVGFPWPGGDGGDTGGDGGALGEFIGQLGERETWIKAAVILVAMALVVGGVYVAVTQ